MARDKRKKIGGEGDITQSSDSALSVSIGAALGMSNDAAPKAEKSESKPQKISARQPQPIDADAFLASTSQATLHRESSGRGGRTVTAVTLKPAPDPATANEISKSMKKGLGCGSQVEGTRIILQGDIQDRAKQWLEKKNVAKIVKGN